MLGSFLILIVSLILAFHAFIAWTLARPIIAPLSSNPMKAVKLPYEDIRFPNSNGSSHLEGWYIPASSGEDASTASDKTVIFSHGYGETGKNYGFHCTVWQKNLTSAIITWLCSITAMYSRAVNV
ncbi:hypothetical protein [Paenibacillus larvae]|uniref:hypothetical protein n=1 Tax=Paenibacillus larvae TaxID=1464 RepID=UPI00288DEE1E|nr:hypothetical protein [Paenibacillus larvae]MDT2192927.1 hypothetical protein [Paenibacillus larvae]MDT2240225.1 hypothetical protein [Paenibacillus larvae]